MYRTYFFPDTNLADGAVRENYVQDNANCIMTFFREGKANRSTAEQMCRDISAGLPTFKTEIELDAMVDILNKRKH